MSKPFFVKRIAVVFQPFSFTVGGPSRVRVVFTSPSRARVHDLRLRAGAQQQQQQQDDKKQTASFSPLYSRPDEVIISLVFGHR